MTKTKQTTSVELVERLQHRNRNGRYSHIIERAKNNGYHCFKFDKIPGHPEYAETSCPKSQLVDDMGKFPELHDVIIDVANGMYDESPDEMDDADIRALLLSEDCEPTIFKALGLDPPTPEEKTEFYLQSKMN